MATGCMIRTHTSVIDPVSGTESPAISKNKAIQLQAVSCLLFDPIRWSRKDTPQTVMQIKRHNQKIDNYCRALP